MTEEDTAYDQRQYKLMLDSIRNFQDGAGISIVLSDLQILIDRLDALHTVLKRPQDTRWQSFQGNVNTLDQVLGMLLSEEKTELDEIGKKIVSEALHEISVLVQSEIHRTE